MFRAENQLASNLSDLLHITLVHHILITHYVADHDCSISTQALFPDIFHSQLRALKDWLSSTRVTANSRVLFRFEIVHTVLRFSPTVARTSPLLTINFK